MAIILLFAKRKTGKLIRNMDTKPTKNIEVGKFYLIHDGSKTGHPGLVMQKDDTSNRYLLIKFDSDKLGDKPKIERGIRHITKLKHPISNDVVTSYVKNRPILCKRKDLWGKELKGLSISEEDLSLIMNISKKEPINGPSLR